MCAIALSAVAFGCSSLSNTGQGDASSKPTWTIGFDKYEPYSYYDEDGQVTGIDYELAVEACNRMGYTPKFVEIVWEKKNELLASGQIDCIWSCYSMTGRETEYKWAGPYMNSYQAAVVRADSSIESLDDLAGKRIAVESTTKSEEAWTTGAQGEVPKVSDIMTFTSMEDTVAAVRMGYADALSGHVGPMSAMVKSSNGTLKLLSDGFYKTQVGVAFSNDFADDALVESLDQTLGDMLADGTVASVAQAYGLDMPQITEVSDEL